MTDITNTKLASDLSKVINRWNTRENQMIDFISKPTGTVTVTDGVGNDHELPSFPQLQLDVTTLTDELTGAVSQAQDINSVSVVLLNQANAGVATIDASLVAAEAAASAADASKTAAATSASQANTHKNTAQTHANTAATQAGIAATKADAASTSADAAAGSASAAATSASNAATSASTASTKASEAQTFRNQANTHKNAAQTHADTANTKATEAAASAAEAEGFKTAAATSASQANARKNAAATSATTATEQADIASGAMEIATDAADIAVTERTAAQAAATTAAQHATRASEWANKAPNSVVEDGKYSARHWAQQAQSVASQAMVFKGEWSAASGQFPANPSSGDLYIVSTAGTVSGISFAIGDQIVRNSNNTAWVKIENVQSVTSVAGKTGAVVLAAGDIKSGTLNAARIPALPVSKITGLQTALDGKAPGAHIHATADMPGLQQALNGKAALEHTHAWSEVTEKPAQATRWPKWGEVTEKPALASASHIHTGADIAGLPDALNSKANKSGQKYTGLHHFQASHVAWGQAPAETIRVELGPDTSASWLITAATGVQFKGGVQMRGSGTVMRLYTIGGYYAELNGNVWNKASIPALDYLPISNGISNLRRMSQSAYNALNPKDPNTIYFIT